MSKNRNIRIVTFWDSLLFLIFNLYQIFLFRKRKVQGKLFFLKKNRDLKDRHLGERCFIILNAPSLLDENLSLLKHENVFCVNHFWASEVYDTVCPNYYVACDTSFFSKEYFQTENNYLNTIISRTKADNSICIFPSSILNLIRYSEIEDHIFITYSKHKPNIHNIKTSLDSISSGFSTVSLYAMNVALYMGFKEIYLLGYELPPWKGGLMPHAHRNTETELVTENKLTSDTTMFSQTALHWQYYQAQLENYLMGIHSNKYGANIFNCTKETYIHSFPYKNFNSLFK